MPTRDTYFDQDSVRIGRYAKTLSEQVADLLVKAINEGVIAPGERLKEEAYAERFAVSRSTIREATAILERRGLAERTPRYGVRVTAVDPDEVEEIFLLRSRILGLAAHLAAEKQPADLLAQLSAGLRKIQTLAASTRTKPVSYMEMSIHMQRLLVGHMTRKRLQRIYEDLSDHALWRFAVREKAIAFNSQQRREESAADWTRVVTAINHADSATAERAAQSLLLASYRWVQSQLKGHSA